MLFWVKTIPFIGSTIHTVPFGMIPWQSSQSLRALEDKSKLQLLGG